jgi:Uma2 family endonuclease
MTIAIIEAAFTPASELWTIDDLEGLPPLVRCEIHNGRLVIMSPVRVWHQNVARAIANAFEKAGRFASTDVTLRRISSDTRIPDVAVFKSPPDLRDAVHSPDTIALVVEVWSPSSDTKDHTQMQWYAERGVAEYWLAEPVGDGSTLDATITKFTLAANADDEPLYVRAGVTTLAELTAQA